MINNGFISLHRKLLDNPISKRPYYLSVFIYLLLNSNFKDCEYILNKKKTVIKRGYFVGSIKKISEYFNISISTVSDILNYFEADNMIKTTRTNKFTIFQIINYDKYQRNDINIPETNCTDTPKTKINVKSFTDKDLQCVEIENRKQTKNKMKQKNNVNNVNTKLNNFVVLLFCKIKNVKPDSSHYSYIGKLLKKDRDNLTYLQRCLLLCFVLKQFEAKSENPKFRGIIFNSYRETSYLDVIANINEYSKSTFVYKHNPLPY